MIEGLDLQALAREIAARMAPDALLDADDVGALMKYSPRYVTEELAKRPWFPKPVNLGAKGQPRWMRADIAACIAARRQEAQKKPGRPRRQLEV